jgi:hypothetical protein
VAWDMRSTLPGFECPLRIARVAREPAARRPHRAATGLDVSTRPPDGVAARGRTKTSLAAQAAGRG